MPDGMTFEEAAAIPANYITAYHMLFEFGNLRKGQSVLVHMAAGGVGTAATQLCKTVTDVTVFGTASASKHDTIRKLGVDYPIDYRTQDYVSEVHKVSPEGVDIVLDPLNGADSVKGFQLLKPFGKIIHFGAANVMTGQHRSYWSMIKTYLRTKNYNPLTMINTNRSVSGYHLGHLIDHPQLILSAAESILDLYQQGKIKPQIDSVWAFDDVGKAMARMHERQNVGKVILVPHKSVTEAGEAK
jgi:NADPH:quinone reductase-like Zn-dependent oxidoreductase